MKQKYDWFTLVVSLVFLGFTISFIPALVKGEKIISNIVGICIEILFLLYFLFSGRRGRLRNNRQREENDEIIRINTERWRIQREEQIKEYERELNRRKIHHYVWYNEDQ